MAHQYDTACNCKRCTKEAARRAAQAAADPRKRKDKTRRAPSRHASKEEQHGRYLDSGPAGWDDR